MSDFVRSAELVNAHAIPLESDRTPAIYFLLRAGRVVYVGQTVDIRFRIETHRREGQKDFDAYAFFPTAPEDLLRAEVANILAHNPEYNRNVPSNPWFITRAQLLKKHRVGWPPVKHAIRAGRLKVWPAAGYEFLSVAQLVAELGEFRETAR